MNSKICILTTVSDSIKAFYRGQLEGLIQAGFDITIVCAKDDKFAAYLPENVRYYPVSFSRVVSPLKDIIAIIRLFLLFRKERFDIIQYSTPNASLLGSIAAFLAHAPIRIYILWGLYYMGQKGLKYKLFKCIEKIICRLSHKILPISHEMVGFALNEGLGKKEKYEVILNGSACGVDLEQFNSLKWAPSRNQIRNQYHLPENGIVIGAVARLTGDKGINELVHAFERISTQISGVYLLLVGDQEQKDRLLRKTENIIKNNPRIRLVGWQENPLPFYAAMDIFCLPTYREGFGEVNLEAQAMGLPVVSTDVIGPRESVVDGFSGFLVPPRSVDAVYEVLNKLVLDKNLREQMGKHGSEHARQKFDRREIVKAVVRHRLALLKQK